MDQFEATSQLMFRQRELFNILVSKSRLIHRGICNRSKLRREFDTGEIVVVRKKVNSIRNDNIPQKLVFFKKGPYRHFYSRLF